MHRFNLENSVTSKSSVLTFVTEKGRKIEIERKGERGRRRKREKIREANKVAFRK